jgi:uncharacterized protein YoxC
MAESKKNSIIVMCAVVGCIVTLITCGTLIGNMQGKQDATSATVEKIEKDVKYLAQAQATMDSKQAYLEGVVSTKLDTIQDTVTKMGLQVDDLIRAD